MVAQREGEGGKPISAAARGIEMVGPPTPTPALNAPILDVPLPLSRS